MIIVTGGAGMIGSNIIKKLNDQNYNDIIVVDNLKNSIKFKNLVDLIINDYIDKDEFLIKILSNNKFGKIEAIFHEGACSNTTELNGKYMLKNNYQYSKKLLQFSLNNRIPFLYASSAAIYGNNTNDFTEECIYQKPLNVYGYSKMLFDQYVSKILHDSKSPVCGLRYFNVYGPRENHKKNMASIIFQINKQIIKGIIPTLFKGSKKFKRDFIYIDDICSVNIWCLEHNISGIYNCGTGCSYSFQEIADIILLYHKKKHIRYISFPKELNDQYQNYTKANLQKLRKTGYDKLFIDIKKGVLKYMNWLNIIDKNKKY